MDTFCAAGVPFDYFKMMDCWEADATDLYSDMFRLGEGLIQQSGERGTLKANPVAYYRNYDEEHGHFRVMFEDEFDKILETLQNADFAILNGLTYFGRKNEQAHANKMYALIFDLDGVTEKKLSNFFRQCVGNVIPSPNYIVLSGHGLHLYYIFEQPLSLFPNIKLQVKELKYALTRRIWNKYTSELDEPQYQGINQGFRVAGGRTKKGCAFSHSIVYRYRKEFFTVSELNQYVPKESWMDEQKIYKETKYTLEEAKEKFPKWYERVVLHKEHAVQKWDIAGKVHGDNPYALYDWWLGQLRVGATMGHRYFCIMILAIYAVKCDVDRERLERDAYGLVPFLNALGDEPFTKSDVESALECYDDRYATFPLRDIEKLSAISLPRNKRNYQKQADHLAEARAIRDVRQQRKGTEWQNTDGRPSAEQAVKEWQAMHPSGFQKDCEAETGLCHATVSKWWKRPVPFEIIREWKELHPNGSKSECKADTGLSYPTIRKWWDVQERKKVNVMEAKKVNVMEISNEECQNTACMIIAECEKMAAELGITPEEAYQIYLENPDNVRLTANVPKKTYVDPNWHTELPEYFVIEGEPNQLEKLLRYASMGVRNVPILSEEEYRYLYDKQTEHLREMASRMTFTPDEVSPELLQKCRERGIELRIVSEEEAAEELVLGWLNSLKNED